MTPRQIQLVRRSFDSVAPIADTAAAMFYERLFSAAPQLRPMFRGDMAGQGRKLMQMIGAAIGLLDRPQALLPVLAQLGARHAGYGVQPAHYHAVGQALLATLADGLGEAFDDETRGAWATMYALVATTMQEASRPEIAVRSAA